MQLSRVNLFLSNVNSLAHEGKVIVVATDDQGKVWYTVKQDGFEDSYLAQSADKRIGWESWSELEFPDEDDDESVLEKEKAENTKQNSSDQFLLRSRYRTQHSAVAPVQLLSAQGHLYVFRQSDTNKLWVDRFVLDGLTNTLVRKLEVRFKRSRKKHEASKAKRSTSGGLSTIDSIDFTDINGRKFYEPTTELGMVGTLSQGWFSVVLLPTLEQDKQRWHIFAYNAEESSVQVTTLLMSEEGLFDIRDYSVLQPEAQTIPGIIRHTLALGITKVANGLAATRFDVQRERDTDDGPQLLRESVRVMLAVGMPEGDVITLNLAVSANGTLVIVETEAQKTTIWRSDRKAVLLPLDTLDEIIAIGASNPPSGGIIKGLGRGDNDEVVVTSLGNAKLADDEITEVKLSGNPDYNAVYDNIVFVDKDTFRITPKGSDAGQWEVVQNEQTGLVFNGLVSEQVVTDDGTLQITALNHGLENGDTVQVVDTHAYNGTYRVTSLDGKRFSLDGVRWQPGTAISARLQSVKRRGIILGEDGGHIVIEAHPNPIDAISVSLWVKSHTATWQGKGYLLATGNAYALQAIEGERTVSFLIPMGDETHNVSFTPDIDLTQWNHIAATFDGHLMMLYINGENVASTPVAGELGEYADELSLALGNSTRDTLHCQLAEVCVWETARTEQELQKAMYLPLAGNESGLVGYWRLNAILEGEPSKVLDMSSNGRDGVVHGGAYPGEVTLERVHKSEGFPTVRFTNDELVAVRERASYVESFEFRLDDREAQSVLPDNPFSISCEGKRSRNANTWQSVAVSPVEFTASADGWTTATARMTIPEGVSLIRSFRIEEFSDNWARLRIRKHRLVLVSNSVSQQDFTHPIRGLLAPPEAVLPDVDDPLVAIGTIQSSMTAKRVEIDKVNVSLASARNKMAILQSTSAQGVVFHWNDNQSGDRFRRGIGDYPDMPEGWNDELASISVPQHLYLVLYEHTNFSGGAMRFNTSHNLDNWDIPGSGTNWKNEASSFQIRTKLGNYSSVDQVRQEIGKTNSSIAEIEKTLSVHQRELSVLRDSLSKITSITPLTEIQSLEPTEIFLKNEQYRLAELIKTLNLKVNNRDAAARQNKRLRESKTRQITQTQGRLKTAQENQAKWTEAVAHGSQKVTLHWNNNRSGDKFSRGLGDYSHMPGSWNDETASISVPSNLYLLLYADTNFRGGVMRFNTNHNLSAWDIPGSGGTNWKNEVSSFKVRTKEGDYSDLAELKANKARAEADVHVFARRLDAYKTELTELKKVRPEADVTRDLEQARIDKLDIDQRLDAVIQALSSANDRYLQALTATERQTMTTISQEDSLLTSTATRLAFVKPVSRIQAVESCTGSVQLNYFDKTGGMRTTLYDCTADSLNSTFEEWLSDADRACLQFQASGDVVALSETTDSLRDWTIEAWVYNHHKSANVRSTLIQGLDGDRQIELDEEQRLGSFIEGEFHSTGFDMTVLKPGWYHLAAVGRVNGDRTGSSMHSTTFYIDGIQEGDVLDVKSSQGVSFIGNQKDGGQPFGKVAEVRVWDQALNADEIMINSKCLLTGLEPGLQLYLPMSEGRGREVRDLVATNIGTIAGAQWWGCTASIGHLKTDVLSLDGKTDYVEVPGHAGLNPEEFTVSLWAFVSGGQGSYRTPVTSRSETGGVKAGYMFYAGDNNNWQFWFGGGTRWWSLNGLPVALNRWTHLSASYANGRATFFIDGAPVSSLAQPLIRNAGSPLRVGAGATEAAAQYFFPGQIAQLQIWSTALNEEQVRTTMHAQLSGREAGLSACFPLDALISATKSGAQQGVPDLCGGNAGILRGASIVSDKQLPVCGAELVCTEYSTVGKERRAMMRRLYASINKNGIEMLSGGRVDLLDLQWLGNGQFAPTLLGYIEGPPPAPSENLTLEDDYREATSVELDLSTDVDFNWSRAQDAGLGASIDAYIGSDVETSILAAPLGVGLEAKSVGVRAGFKGNLDFSYQFQNDSSITSSSSLSMTDSLTMVGTQELDAHFKHLGKRFIPKNVGYALVVSSTADIFVTRLQRRKTMIGYQVLPVENIPPDVNTITFMINPAYTMSGSLDGLTGSSATSDRFHKHVPAMRSYFGSQYPASYYRLQEAYALKHKIEKQDKRRESYFEQFNSLLVSEEGIDQDVDVKVADDSQLLVPDGTASGDNQTPEDKKQQEEDLKKANQKLKDDAEGMQEKQAKQVEQRKADINTYIDDQEQRSHATASFAQWQKRMERIQIDAGKRNIVNTYVWDADGGLRSESQSFATSAEHSIGGSFSLNAGLGAEGNFSVMGVAVELTAQATVNMTQTMSKTEFRSQGIQLNVDLSGVESRGVTDHNDLPLLPGEKVNRYRFMSFYLEGSTEHFNDFFSEVVDPEWLASNSEEARALRQANGKANKTWRVMHRVTYVERPALAGFGADARSLPQSSPTDELEHLQKSVDLLENQNEKLEKKLDAILKRLSTVPS